jgi:ATP-dependent exoDNAse (exonuclease V) alpha subunit
MIREHDSVILTEDLPETGLRNGDIGTVVHIHPGAKGYEVEFITLAGKTVAVETLSPAQVRAIAPGDLAHVRELTAS